MEKASTVGKMDDSTSNPIKHFRPFPNLPSYKPPSSGLLSWIPPSILPYAELARLDKPGYAPLWMIHTYGILQAGVFLHAPPSKVFSLIAFFCTACELLMCANFAWNDSCDASYDGKVARTRHRPLVRGAVSLSASLIFDCVLAITLAAFLMPLPRACTMYAVPMALGCFLYPLSKRWTNYPQIVLSVVFPSGIFMGAAAVGAIPLAYPTSLMTIFQSETWKAPEPSQGRVFLAGYLTNVVWTFLFEVIYSFQDVQWDEDAGVGTVTVLLKRHTSPKMLLVMLAVAQTSLHAYTGFLAQAHCLSWGSSVAATLATLLTQISNVRLDQEESCMFWFAAGNLLTGLAMLIGYTGEFYFHT